MGNGLLTGVPMREMPYQDFLPGFVIRLTINEL
jgi:hypothetical protein